MTENLSEILTHPFVIGGASAGLIAYFISSAVQGIAIYRICKKVHIGKAARIILTAMVILPFGTGVSLAAIAYDKKHKAGD